MLAINGLRSVTKDMKDEYGEGFDPSDLVEHMKLCRKAESLIAAIQDSKVTYERPEMPSGPDWKPLPANEKIATIPTDADCIVRTWWVVSHLSGKSWLESFLIAKTSDGLIQLKIGNGVFPHSKRHHPDGWDRCISAPEVKYSVKSNTQN